MKIYLLDINNEMCEAWEEYFNNLDDVEIVNSSFKNFMDNHLEIDAVVSPANSFGLMDGGYDLAITQYFGTQLMKDVKEQISMLWYGEQPVGTSISVIIPNRIAISTKIFNYKKPAILIHTPTMRTPERITDSRIIYQCMRTTLIEAIKNKIDYIVIPAFGGLTGRLPFSEIARQMYLAYEQIQNRPTEPKEINWKYAMTIAQKVKYKE